MQRNRAIILFHLQDRLNYRRDTCYGLFNLFQIDHSLSQHLFCFLFFGFKILLFIVMGETKPQHKAQKQKETKKNEYSS